MKKFSAEQKLTIYQDYLSCQNKSAISRDYQIDRSYLNEIISECEEILLDYFKQKKAGRKKSGTPQNYSEALIKIKALEEQNQRLAKAKEELYVKNEFLELRLSWAEDGSDSKGNRHLKKNRNNRSSTNTTS